jgi:hopene-associated glycosyltransferase HpnB
MTMVTLLCAALAGFSLVAWIVLVFFWGGFWQIARSDADHDPMPSIADRPRICVIVPARNEAAMIAQSVISLAEQNYPGEFRIFVVDDHSEDGTASIARGAAEKAGASSRVEILAAPQLAPGWTGKLSAMNAGVHAAAQSAPEYFWFTDADIAHSPDSLRRLVARGLAQRFDLASLMVLLRTDTFPEKLLIPAFLYFFLMLYPPRWIAGSSGRTAGAAGGCILMRADTLERIGGLAAIRGEVIDDCALARAVKRSGGRIWMGLTRSSRSLRGYGSFSELRDLIARTAFTQLKYSTFLLFGTLLGMILVFVSPAALTFSPSAHVWPLALLAWCLMSVSFMPTLAFYRVSPILAPVLPIVVLFYLYATCLSAVRYWIGRGGQWKGRAQAQPHND